MHMIREDKVPKHVCIVNVGHFRSGSMTLVEAAKRLGLTTFREFPDLTAHQYKEFLQDPATAVKSWFVTDGGKQEVLSLAGEYNLICDGWIALLPFLPPITITSLKQEALELGIDLVFVATKRDVESTVQSELHHWTRYGLERKANLNQEDRELLEKHLRKRACEHERRIQGLSSSLSILPLGDSIQDMWPNVLSAKTNFSRKEWSDGFEAVGRQNANPPLPIEGILLTLRLGDDAEKAERKIASVLVLLDQIEADNICRYLLVLALDCDERDSALAKDLVNKLQERVRDHDQLQSLYLITNSPRSEDQPFAICSVWNEMASVAWKHGADWVVLLGDDVEIDCSFHYRAFYRTFLDISDRLKVPFGFGCPWWNDTSFPAFPSFPCVGKAHFKIYGNLIPEHRQKCFVNQDLDPYLKRLYSKFMAAPCVTAACLRNGTGGNSGSGEARYRRIPAKRWQDFAVDDIKPMQNYLPKGTREAILLDVVVPSYRVRLDYLQSICSLRVPDYMDTIFIIIVDNPSVLVQTAKSDDLAQSAQTVVHDTGNITLSDSEKILEHYLSTFGNVVRVRSNKKNVGASASRNRGLDESAAEFVLNLDDDLIPSSGLLESYGRKLQDIDNSIVGLIGLVRFPRSKSLPLRHAAVLMSYLTFMFEVAEKDLYPNPAWGVTANILFRRTTVRFDLAYAKTGGGEDVDFALRISEDRNGAKLLTVPEAFVVHPFWPGSVLVLFGHFFNWAIGDCCLFSRFPEHRYWSFPNVSEVIFLLSPFVPWIGPADFFLKLVPGLLGIDFIVDFAVQRDYKYRCQQLQEPGLKENKKFERSPLFYFAAHILANLYVVVLEFGRLYGHGKRNDLVHSIFHRFDWHCGQLPNARKNFRNREGCKFGLIVLYLMWWFFGCYWMEDFGRSEL